MGDSSKAGNKLTVYLTETSYIYRDVCLYWYLVPANFIYCNELR